MSRRLLPAELKARKYVPAFAAAFKGRAAYTQKVPTAGFEPTLTQICAAYHLPM